jgi:hypothetical protein
LLRSGQFDRRAGDCFDSLFSWVHASPTSSTSPNVICGQSGSLFLEKTPLRLVRRRYGHAANYFLTTR